MHEFSIISSLFKILLESAEKARMKTIKRVVLETGGMRQIVPDFMVSAFDIVKKDTPAKDAVLEIRVLPVLMKCRSCSREFEVTDRIFLCPGCGGFDLELVQGRELIIKSIEGEVD